MLEIERLVEYKGSGQSPEQQLLEEALAILREILTGRCETLIRALLRGPIIDGPSVYNAVTFSAGGVIPTKLSLVTFLGIEDKPTFFV